MGVTSNLALRVWQHQSQLVEGFTKRYGVHTLACYEVHATLESALAREKAIKNWKQAWKIALIEKSNSQWHDLYEELGRLDSGFRRNDEGDGFPSCLGVLASRLWQAHLRLIIKPVNLG